MADEHTEAENMDERDAAEQPENEAAAEEPQTDEDLKAELERLQTALKEAGEQTLRAQAEAQNTLRRAEKDIEKAHKYGQERLVSDLLYVVVDPRIDFS